MPSLVEFARLICPTPATVSKQVEKALTDPAAYVKANLDALDSRGIKKPVDNLALLVLIDALIERGLATELDWREEADAVLEQVLALKSVPGTKALGVEEPDLDDDLTCVEAMQLAEAELAPAKIVLATIDIQSDSYPTIAVDAAAFPELSKLAGKCGVPLKKVSELPDPHRKKSAKKKTPPAAKAPTSGSPLEKLVAREIASLKKESEAELREQLAEMESDLLEDDDDDRTTGISLLRDHGAFLLQRQLLERTGSPWDDVARYEAYSAIWYTFRKPDEMRAWSSGESLYEALATGHTGRIDRLLRIGQEALRDGAERSWADEADTYPAAAFAFWLAARAANQKLDVPLEKPFAELAKQWTKPADLRPIADYHLKAVKEEDEFRFSYFALIPVELVAIRTVRDRLGLKTIWPEDHPLVTNPLAQAYLTRPAGTFDRRKDRFYPLAVEVLKKQKRIPAGVDPWTV